MSWVFGSGEEFFQEVRSEWDCLNRSQGDCILLDSVFVAALIRCFGHKKLLLGVSRDAGRAGMAFVEATGSGNWSTFQPSQAPLGLILLADRKDSFGSLRHMMRALPGYALVLGVMCQDPRYSSFPPVATGPDIEVLPYIQSARLSLSSSYEDFWNSRSKTLREKLAKHRRRLAREGRVLELSTHTLSDEVASCVREHGRLESNGWKGQEGTAIAADNIQGAFYTHVLEEHCARNEGVIYQLRLDGQVIASRLCLCRDRTLYILKTAYDENFAQFSPGILLMQDILKHAYTQRQIQTIEFYGRVMEWHTKWTEDIRAFYHINCLRHRWLGAVRQIVKQCL